MVVGNTSMGPESGTIGLVGVGVPPPRIEVGPCPINFTAAVGQEQCMDVAIRNRGGADLIVLSVAITQGMPPFSVNPVPPVPITIRGGQESIIRVCFRPTQDGVFRGVLTIMSNDPMNMTTTCELIGRTPPNIVVGPRGGGSCPIMFTASVGQQQCIEVAIKNTGGQDLVVSSIAVTQGFVIDPAPMLPLTIMPGGEAIINVCCRPTQEGTFTGMLTVRSNDPDMGTVTCELFRLALGGPILNLPAGIAVASSMFDTGTGNHQSVGLRVGSEPIFTPIFIADTGNHRVLRVDENSVIRVAGQPGSPGFSGDGGPARAAFLDTPTAVVVSPAGDLFILESGASRRIRRIQPGQDGQVAGRPEEIITTVVGPSLNLPDVAYLYDPKGLAIHGENLFIADTGNDRVLRLDMTTGEITVVVGQAFRRGPLGDNGPAGAARLNKPSGLAFDSSGNLYIADSKSHRIRMIDPGKDGIITPEDTIITVAGTGQKGFDGDDRPATVAQLNGPSGLAFDSNGNLFIADTENHRIRRIARGNKDGITGESSETIITVAGGQPCPCSCIRGGDCKGDGGLAKDAHLYCPNGVAVDPSGILFIADTNNHRVRVVMKDGTITSLLRQTCPPPTTEEDQMLDVEKERKK
jgi:DNA-binding beta-propeller fold protein YncE